ncbi:MAG TPA: phage holin family protein [Kiloniellaceae bacterium]
MSDTSIGNLVSGLVSDIGLLIRQELRLAQAETAEKLEQAQNGIYAVITGLLLAFCGLLILLQALVLGLSNHMPDWVAALLVGGVLAIIAFVLIHQGAKNLKPGNLIPERTLRAGRAGGGANLTPAAPQHERGAQGGR